MDPAGLDVLNAAVGAVLKALARIAPAPPPRPVRLWVRPTPSTVLPVVISVRIGSARINLSMDLSTALEIADRTLKARGSYASGFSPSVQESLRDVFSGIAAALAEVRPEWRDERGSPLLAFGQRITTRSRECPGPVTAAVWSEAGKVEIDVAAAGIGGGKEERARTGLPALQG